MRRAQATCILGLGGKGLIVNPDGTDTPLEPDDTSITADPESFKLFLAEKLGEWTGGAKLEDKDDRKIVAMNGTAFEHKIVAMNGLRERVARYG